MTISVNYWMAICSRPECNSSAPDGVRQFAGGDIVSAQRDGAGQAGRHAIAVPLAVTIVYRKATGCNRESVWYCSDGKAEGTTIEGAKAGRKKKAELRSPVIAGGLLKALLGVMQRSPASRSRAATAVYLPLTGWWGFAI